MAYDVGMAFARIEEELIDSMMRNMRRHNNEEDAEGFDWPQWQAEQLQNLEEYRRKNEEKYGPQFQEINAKLEEALQQARESGRNEEEATILEAISNNKRLQRRISRNTIGTASFFRINESKLDALIKATTSDFERAEYAILRRCNDQYRKIIFNAQVYANTGAGTYAKAVDMATKDFLAAGINCVEYKNGARHTVSDYADMAIRTANKRAYLMGQGEMRAEWGIPTVIVNRRGSGGKHGSACPRCIPWLGRVLIDDVWSGGEAYINGKNRQQSSGVKAMPTGTSPFTEKKYPLMSAAIAAGLYHPRCKDSHTTYFEGISSDPEPVSQEEIANAVQEEKEENRAHYVKRQAEKWGRLAEYALDPENKRKYEARAEEWDEQTSSFKSAEAIGANGSHVIDYMDALNFSGNNAQLAKMLRSGDAQQISEVVDNILSERYNLKDSAWLGQTIVVSDGSLGKKVNGLAFWDQKIYICESEKTNLKLHIHEQLHMRSVIKHGKKGRLLLTRFRGLEEGPVELLSQAICKENHIDFTGAYSSYVNPLRSIHNIVCHNESEYEFARKLFDIPLDERYNYLEEIVDIYKDSHSYIRDHILNRLDESLNALKEVTS